MVTFARTRPFAGSPGVLLLTDRRLAFLKGAFARSETDLRRVDEPLVRRKRSALCLRDVAEAALDGGSGAGAVMVAGAAFLGSGARLAVQSHGPSGVERHPFVVSGAGVAGRMEPWLRAIEAARDSP